MNWNETNKKAQEICDKVEVGCGHPTLSGPCHQCVIIFLHGKLEEAAGHLFNPYGDREYDTDDLLNAADRAFKVVKDFKKPDEEDGEDGE